MRSFPRMILTGLACVAVGVGVGTGVMRWLMPAGRSRAIGARHSGSSSDLRGHGGAALPESDAADVSGPERTARFVGPGVHRPASVRLAHPGRDRTVHRQGPGRGLASRVPRGDRASRRSGQGAAPASGSMVSISTRSPSLDQALQALWVYRQLAFVALYEGDHDEAAAWLERSLELSRTPGVPTSVRANMMALLGINALRRGEKENCLGCVGPSSCIFPIAREAVHTQPVGLARGGRAGSPRISTSGPATCAIRWLLNIAAMTLGEYPEKVPPRYLIPLDPFRSKLDLGRFENVATRVGLIGAGPEPGRRQHLRRLQRRRPARPVHDLVRRRPGGLAVRQPRRRHVRGPIGRGRPGRAGLCPERHPRRLSTTTATSTSCSPRRLGEPGPALAAAEQGGRRLRGRDRRRRPGRADLDRVGRLGRLRQRRPARPVRLRRVSPGPTRSAETPSTAATPATAAGSTTTRATARSRTSPTKAGVLNERWAKGSAWGDYDGDGRLDLFVSNMDRPVPALPQPRRRHVPRRRPRARRRRAADTASPAGSGTTTTTAGSTSSSTTTAATSPRSSPITSACRCKSEDHPTSTATSARTGSAR